jgi:hypothetical protein
MLYSSPAILRPAVSPRSVRSKFAFDDMAVTSEAGVLKVICVILVTLPVLKAMRMVKFSSRVPEVALVSVATVCRCIVGYAFYRSITAPMACP